MRYIFKFKAYAIQLNTNAYIEKTTITDWLAENIQGYILDHQMIFISFNLFQLYAIVLST